LNDTPKYPTRGSSARGRKPASGSFRKLKCCRSVNARPSGTIDSTIGPDLFVAAKVSDASISVLSGNPLVFARYTDDRSRANVYAPCCDRARVPTTSFQSRRATSVASTSSLPDSSARSGSAATVLGGNASATDRTCSALPDELRYAQFSSTSSTLSPSRSKRAT
jgi:hypothetical protein